MSYDKAGSRLHHIGDFQISYDKSRQPPQEPLGASISTMTWQGLLRHVGADQIEGTTSSAADQRGSETSNWPTTTSGRKPVRIGNMGVEYDMAGNRVRRIGGLTVDYDKLGSRPRYLRADGEEPRRADVRGRLPGLSRVRRRSLRVVSGDHSPPFRGGVHASSTGFRSVLGCGRSRLPVRAGQRGMKSMTTRPSSSPASSWRKWPKRCGWSGGWARVPGRSFCRIGAIALVIGSLSLNASKNGSLLA